MLNINIIYYIYIISLCDMSLGCKCERGMSCGLKDEAFTRKRPAKELFSGLLSQGGAGRRDSQEANKDEGLWDPLAGLQRKKQRGNGPSKTSFGKGGTSGHGQNSK